MKFPMIRAGTELRPSRLYSHFYWRNKTNQFKDIPIRNEGIVINRDIYLDSKDGFCDTCDNKTYRVEDDQIYCLCQVLQMEYTYKERHDPIKSIHRKEKKLSNFSIHGDPESQILLKQVKGYFKNWMVNPCQWVVLKGPVGTGKTHILEAVANLGPIALFITSGDFESKIFLNLETGTLDKFIKDVRRAPILLIDDFGSDYGSDIIRQKMREVINMRYMLRQHYITVISTNLDENTFRLLDPRVLDRFYECAHWFDFRPVSSYRKRTGDQSWKNT